MASSATKSVTVVISADQIKRSPDLIVFPEGISWDQIRLASTGYPNALIVGGVSEDDRIRGVLWHAGKNRIEYLKIATDGRTHGSDDLTQALPVYEFEDISVGVVICMDIDAGFGAFGRAVIDRIRSSNRRWKFLCMPANMGAYWFDGNNVGPNFVGLHVALCNHTEFHESRCPSFVTDTAGNKIRTQQSHEPIHIRLLV